MHHRPAHIDLPEARHFLPEVSVFHAWEKNKKALILDFLFERDLCAGQKTHCHVRLTDCGESSCRGILELRCYQLVADLCGSGGDEAQTVVAHCSHSFRPTCVGVAPWDARRDPGQ